MFCAPSFIVTSPTYPMLAAWAKGDFMNVPNRDGIDKYMAAGRILTVRCATTVVAAWFMGFWCNPKLSVQHLFIRGIRSRICNSK